ncbi:MAG TPA: Trm112 family protein, partial [Blastocatellia bacterium]
RTALGVNQFFTRRFIMSVSPDLLEILRCPACKSKVEMKPDGGGLKCVSCRRVYPIRDELPIMLVDEAVIEEEDVGSSLSTAS